MLMPVIQNTAYGFDVSAIINHMAQLIAATTTRKGIDQITQVIQELDKKIATTSDQNKADMAISQKSTDVASDSNTGGDASQAIAEIAAQLAPNPDKVHQTLTNIAQTISNGPPPPFVVAIIMETAELIPVHSQLIISSAVTIRDGIGHHRGVSEIEQNNWVIFVSDSRIPIDFIELTLGHIIIQTANEGGESTAQRVASEIANIVANSPSGDLSRSIYQIATLKANGDVTLANKIIDAISKSLASGGNVIQIPTIVKGVISSQPSSSGGSTQGSSGGSSSHGSTSAGSGDGGSTPHKSTPHKSTPHKSTPHKSTPHKETGGRGGGSTSSGGSSSGGSSSGGSSSGGSSSGGSSSGGAESPKCTGDTLTNGKGCQTP
jgi:hypothetical protein